MAKYTVHFSGYWGYDIDVKAKNKEEAIKKAEEIFEDVSVKKYYYESGETDVWEAR